MGSSKACHLTCGSLHDLPVAREAAGVGGPVTRKEKGPDRGALPGSHSAQSVDSDSRFLTLLTQNPALSA